MSANVVRFPTRQTNPAPQFGHVPITDGVTLFGEVLPHRGGQFEAIRADGTSLGFYNRLSSAAGALVEDLTFGRVAQV